MTKCEQNPNINAMKLVLGFLGYLHIAVVHCDYKCISNEPKTLDLDTQLLGSETWQNPSYPGSDTDAFSCTINVQRTKIKDNATADTSASDTYVQIKVTYQEFYLKQPNATGFCVDDKLVITGGNQRLARIPISVCGAEFQDTTTVTDTVYYHYYHRKLSAINYCILIECTFSVSRIHQFQRGERR